MSHLMTPQQRDTFFKSLHKAYPDPRCELDYTNPFTLMVAIILSAQSTDKNVNKTTPALFAQADTPYKMLKLGDERLNNLIRTINYHNNKTRSILNLSQVLVDTYDGQIPQDFDTLITLPGIGKKTASVFLNVAYNAPLIGVDTHVFRLIHRLKIGTAKTPESAQEMLQKIVPDKFKPTFALGLVLLGRYVCTARKLHCDTCPVYNACYANEKQERTP